MYNKPGSTRKRAPAADERVTITKCPTVAAGLPAIYQTVRFGLREMGPGPRIQDVAGGEQEEGIRLPKLRAGSDQQRGRPFEYADE